MSLSPSRFSICEQHQWRYAMMVLAFVVVQFFSQLHALEHFDEHDGDSHSELGCNLCILTADLESSAATAGFSPGTELPSGIVSVPTPGIPRFSSPNYGFDARAPPPPVVRHYS